VRRQAAAVLALLVFACLETVLAADYSVFVITGRSLASSTLGLQRLGLQTSGTSDIVQAVFWKNSYSLAAVSWAVLGISFFRQGISRRWRSLGFDRNVFQLMVTMRGAQSRLALLNYLSEPKHKTELSKLSGLDWKEVDRELNLLLRFGLISLHAQSGSVKIYRLSEQGKLLLKLILELKQKTPMSVALRSSTDSESEPPMR